jgi:hypothetical protein
MALSSGFRNIIHGYLANLAHLQSIAYKSTLAHNMLPMLWLTSPRRYSPTMLWNELILYICKTFAEPGPAYTVSRPKTATKTILKTFILAMLLFSPLASSLRGMHSSYSALCSSLA